MYTHPGHTSSKCIQAGRQAYGPPGHAQLGSIWLDLGGHLSCLCLHPLRWNRLIEYSVSFYARVGVIRCNAVTIRFQSVLAPSLDVNSVHPLCTPSRHLVWEKDMPCLLQVIPALIFTVISVCMQPFIHTSVSNFLSAGEGLVPLKPKSGSGLCQSTLRGHHSAYSCYVHLSVGWRRPRPALYRWLMNTRAIWTIAGTLVALHTTGQIAIKRSPKSRNGTPQKQLATKTGKKKKTKKKTPLSLMPSCKTVANKFVLWKPLFVGSNLSIFCGACSSWEMYK